MKGTRPPRSADSRKPALFLARFAAYAGLFFLFVTWTWTDQHASRPLTIAITWMTGALMRIFGLEVVQTATELAWRGERVSVLNGCNAIEALGILWAAVLAFPAPARSRLGAIVVGSVVIQAVNLVRVASLVVARSLAPSAFPLLHEAIWPALIILLAMAIWLAWIVNWVRPAERAAAEKVTRDP